MTFFAAFVAALAHGTARADDVRGTVVELHSCEVYTGGCTASAEATLEGRSMLRLWNIASGQQDGVDLAGLNVASLETADANLAIAGTKPRAAVVYVPENATQTQRVALVSWLKSTALPKYVGLTTVRTAPLSFAKNSQDEISVVVGANGEIATLTTANLPPCGTGSCGEALWYEPRTRLNHFSVVLNEASSVDEPLLLLRWKNNRTRSVFVGEFGPEIASSQGVLAQVQPQPQS